MTVSASLQGSIGSRCRKPIGRIPTSQSAPLTIAAFVGGLMLILPLAPQGSADAASPMHPNTGSCFCGPLLAGELTSATASDERDAIVGPAGSNVRADDNDDDENGDDSDNADDSDDPNAADWQVIPTGVVEA
jgi:hypothetical protein